MPLYSTWNDVISFAITTLFVLLIQNVFQRFYFRETSQMKSSRNEEITPPFTYVGICKSCTGRELFNTTNMSLNGIYYNKILVNISEICSILRLCKFAIGPYFVTKRFGSVLVWKSYQADCLLLILLIYIYHRTSHLGVILRYAIKIDKTLVVYRFRNVTFRHPF